MLKVGVWRGKVRDFANKEGCCLSASILASSAFSFLISTSFWLNYGPLYLF